MRWVLVVLAALVLLAVWVGAILFPELRGIAEWTTAVIVLIVVVIVLVRVVRKRMKAMAMERELVKAPPDERPEVVELRAQMQRGVASLKTTRRSKTALYDLPWYAIVGPPAAGKTTALARSGLSFVAGDKGSPKIRGAAGTRNCDWWLSPEAILLDTAGRYATSDDDHEEWLAFLDTLGRFRPERALDGVLVAVSVSDVATATEDQRTELATRLRARTDEILTRLEMVVPVYLLFTKADLVAGFAESMADLTKAQRDQVWGASFGLNDPRLAEPGRAVEAEIDHLAETQHARAIDRLPSERNPSRRARILQLPLELAALATPLGQFVDCLFKPGADGEAPVLRGFYLTSGTQVGRPVDRVLSDMARGFQLGPASAAAGAGETQSYFLTDLFRTVLFPDRHLAIRSRAASERRSRREMRAALAVVGVVAFVLLPAIVSYVRNMQIVNAAAAVAALPATTEPGTKDDPIEGMADLLTHIERETSGLGIPGWFGPRASTALEGPLRQAYVARLHAELLARIRPDLDRRLRAVASAGGLSDAPVTADDRTPLAEAYETVKLYSTLVSPAQHVDVAWATPLLMHMWLAALPASDAVSTERLSEHTRSYLTALAAGRAPAWAAPAFLQTARERLRRSDVRGLPYRRTLLWAGDVPPVRASEVFGAASLEFLDCRGDVQVPGPFTAPGWEKIRAALDSSTPWPASALVAQWVVDDGNVASDEQALRAQVRAQYFDDYVRHWMMFLDELKVRTPPNLTAARAELQALAGTDGFYKALFALFKVNAIHDAPPSTPLATAQGLLSKLPWIGADSGLAPKDPGPSPVEKAFRPLLAFSGELGDADKAGAGGPAGLDKYRVILDKLKAALDSPKPTGADAQSQTQFAEAATGVDTLLDSVEEPAHGRLRRLLLPPVLGTMSVAKTQGFGSATAEWKATVYDTFADLSTKYPFKPNASQAASFGDFSAFFKPDTGPLWSYVKGHLGDYVEPGGRGYVMKPAADPLDPSILACLDVAQEITDAFFPPGEEPGLRFAIEADWTATDVTEAKVWIGATATPLARGRWSPALRWFGEDVKLEWVQAGQPTQQIGRRPFSLYDLFKQMGGLSASGGRGDVYGGEFPPLTIKVRSAGKGDPFQASFYSRLRCPEQIRGAGP